VRKTNQTHWGGNLRYQPIICWCCEGDHMFKDFPHNDSKTITMINVQEDYIVEHMGGSMPRIYTALYNWQVEHQA